MSSRLDVYRWKCGTVLESHSERFNGQLGADPAGLTSAEAKRRLLLSGPNRLHTRKHTDVLILLLAQFKKEP